MSNTPLVVYLSSVGIYYKRAEAFERCLDDRPMCGISGCKLADLISKIVQREVAIHQMNAAIVEQQKAKAARIPLALFEQTPYGTSTARGARPGSQR